jgi:hypothetical protein
MSICIMQNAWFSVFLSHKPIHWLQKLLSINENQFLWTFTCTHREQNFQPEFIFVNATHDTSLEVLKCFIAYEKSGR